MIALAVNNGKFATRYPFSQKSTRRNQRRHLCMYDKIQGGGY